MQIPPPAGVADHEGNRKIDEGGSSQRPGFAPVKARMRYENHDTAIEQSNESDRRDPVRDADDRRVPRRIQAFRASDGSPGRYADCTIASNADSSTRTCGNQ